MDYSSRYCQVGKNKWSLKHEKCIGCGTTKIRHNSHGRCIKCHVNKLREKNLEYYQEYQKDRWNEWYSDPKNAKKHKKKNSEYSKTEKGKEVEARAKKKYYKSEKGKKTIFKYSKEWRKNNPERFKAHQHIKNLCRRKGFEKPVVCEVCGRNKCQIVGHHEDYTKPLEVIWCCKSCHYKFHN